MESDCCYEDEIYLDNNATTRPLPQVREEMMKVLGYEFGNPSSSHSTGERARKHLLKARDTISKLLGVNSENLIFTSSGTEANNLVFYSCTYNSEKKSSIVTTVVEHSSIKKMCSHLEINGAEVVYLNVDSNGYVDTNELESLLEQDTCLVSIQWISNETGVIQPIEDIAKICNEKGVLFHTDAAQVIGKLKIDLNKVPVDFLTFAGHKFHSPQGCGGLYVRDKFLIHPILFGGFQEEGFRPGTENLPGIVGMGKAAEIRFSDLDSTIKKLADLRDSFESKILETIPETTINGDAKNRVCNTTNIRFAGIDGRELLGLLDKNGVRCSQSSACTSFDTAPSYVLIAMGLTEEDAYSSIRFSFSVENSSEEVERAVHIIKKLCEELRS